MRISALLHATAGVALAGIIGASAGAAAPSESCDTETVRSMAPADTTVAFAAREFGGTCRVHGYVTTRDPGPNKVLFVLMLPDNFNGRYLYQGVGGAAGSLPSVPVNLLRRGYADWRERWRLRRQEFSRLQLQFGSGQANGFRMARRARQRRCDTTDHQEVLQARRYPPLCDWLLRWRPHGYGERATVWPPGFRRIHRRGHALS